MNWALLQNSLLLAAAVATLATFVGAACAVWSRTLPGRLGSIVTAFSGIALALPPFMVANTWMHFFGLAGVWRPWVNFELYSRGGTILLMSLLLWPVSFFLTRAALARLDLERIEADPLLKGWRLARWVLWPHLRSTLWAALVISFVLALNHFSIPALLQIKVYSADVWVSFNSSFDFKEALRIGWPLVIAPLALLIFLRRNIEVWPARKAIAGERFAASLGRVWILTFGAISVSLLLASVIFPFGHLATSAGTWQQMGSAFSAGQTAFRTSLVTSIGGATLTATAALLLARRREASVAWLPFLIPGVVLGIGVIRVFNHSALAWLYPSVGLVIAVLALRYLALPLQAVAEARRGLDLTFLAAARADGATARQAFWKTELPILAGPIFFAWYLAYLFCLWDAETMIMIVPPGGETLSLRVFNMLHYGHTEQVNALCLWLLGLAIAPLLLRLIGFKAFGRSALVPFALILGGCSQAPEGVTAVKSQLFSHVEVIGHRGNGAGEFNKPRSVGIDAEDNLYVVDITGRVQKFSPTGDYLLSWQMPQTDKGKPKGMALDPEGNVIIGEPHYNRINHYKTDGALVFNWGAEGTNAGQLVFPRSVAVNSAGEIYVSEYGLVERVQRFSPHGTNLLTVIGSGGEKAGEFRRAEGIGVDGSDRLFVADSCNHRVQIFSREGKLLRQHGRAGAGPEQMSYPYDVRVDRAGFEYVCEFGNSRVQIFDEDGRFVEILGGAGGDPGKMNNPWAICLDSKGNLYIADSGNHRVQKFVRKSPIASAQIVPALDASQPANDANPTQAKGGGA